MHTRRAMLPGVVPAAEAAAAAAPDAAPSADSIGWRNRDPFVTPWRHGLVVLAAAVAVASVLSPRVAAQSAATPAANQTAPGASASAAGSSATAASAAAAGSVLASVGSASGSTFVPTNASSRAVAGLNTYHDPVPMGYGVEGRATATFYGGPDAKGTWGGNCGYGDLVQAGYGLLVAAGSQPLYQGGLGCGSCFRVKCVNSRYCTGNSIVVPITDLCPGGPVGGHCCTSCVHFDLSQPAFTTIADVVAGVVDLAYSRVPCTFLGPMRLTATGSAYWLNILVENAAGPGDLSMMEVLDSSAGAYWRQMTHSWGANWKYDGFLQAPLTLRLTSRTFGYKVTTTKNCIPANWKPDTTFTCDAQFPLPDKAPTPDFGNANAAPKRRPPPRRSPKPKPRSKSPPRRALIPPISPRPKPSRSPRPKPRPGRSPKPKPRPISRPGGKKRGGGHGQGVGHHGTRNGRVVGHHPRGKGGHRRRSSSP